MAHESVTRRGVYKDLSLSPYEYVSPYGDIFKFSSQKKLEIYTRDVPKEIERVSKCVGRLGLDSYIPAEIVQIMYRYTYKAFYDSVEG